MKKRSEVTTKTVTEEATAIFSVSESNDLSVVICIVVMIFIHAASLRSGSHFPFPIHVDALGPESINPEVQVRDTSAPLIAGSLNPIVVIDSPTNCAGF